MFLTRQRSVTASKAFILAAFVAIATFYAQLSVAVPTTFGPFVDFRGPVLLPGPVVIPTRGTFDIPIPFDGTLRFRFRDRITLVPVPPVPIPPILPIPLFTATYVTVDLLGAGLVAADVGLTDVFALDLNGPLGGPNGDVPLLTGFDATDPQLAPASAEEFIGISGTIYTAPVETVTLADLDTRLTDFDLSRFTGDPNLIVFVAQATVPLRDVTIAEPSNLTLLGLGLLGLFALARRHIGA
jgi:hypothetical protein